MVAPRDTERPSLSAVPDLEAFIQETYAAGSVSDAAGARLELAPHSIERAA